MDARLAITLTLPSGKTDSALSVRRDFVSFPVMDELRQCVESLGIERVSRHIFLCADQTEAECCSREAGLESWEYLKKRLKELGADPYVD